MRLLLDTCTFLWIAAGSRQLSKNAADLFRNPSHEVFLSAISASEIALKNSIGQLPLPDSPVEFVADLRERHGITALPLREEEAAYLPRLPRLHRDPFGRMLVCQALVNGLALLTPDPLITQYPIRTLW